MYSPKIKNDLICIIYEKAQLEGKPMTDIVDSLLRPQLVEDTSDTVMYICHNCRTEVEILLDNSKGYCEQCECIVFVEKS